MTHMLSDLNDKMMNFLSVKHNALAAVYPPGGFIAWHNNANAPAFNLIFSYSESGAGWFDYIHPETKEVIRCQDKLQVSGLVRQHTSDTMDKKKTNVSRCIFRR